MEFRYVAVDATGKKVKGYRNADNEAELEHQLSRSNLILLHCRTRLFSLSIIPRTMLSKNFILEFSRQMSILLLAGLSLSQALLVVEQELKHKTEKLFLQSLQKQVQQGQGLAQAIEDIKLGFDKHYCDVIAVGEETGRLADAFAQNFQHLTAQLQLKRQLKQACIYPVSVLLVSFVVIAILLVKVIPGFESLFSSFDQQLPLATQWVINSAKLLQEHGVSISVSLLMVVFAIKIANKFAYTAFQLDRVKLLLPIVGKSLTLNFYAAFSLSCHNLLKAGIPLHLALLKVKATIRNKVWLAKLDLVEQELRAGKSFYLACEQSTLFPIAFLQLIKVGEETGSLDVRLGNLTEVYQKQLDDYVKQVMSLMEPCLIIFLGVTIGGLVLVMYLPIFSMSTFL